MALINCYECGKEISDMAMTCPQCGAPQKQIGKFADRGVVINGVKWATRNVDKPGTFVAKPEYAGMYYQWNSKRALAATDHINDYIIWKDIIEKGNTWEKVNDPCPEGWRMPDSSEMYSLFDERKVDYQWTIQNGIEGGKFTDKDNGNSIFLPATGYLDDGSTYFRMKRNVWKNIPAMSYYWISDPVCVENGYKMTLIFHNKRAGTDSFKIGRHGFCVRPVEQ